MESLRIEIASAAGGGLVLIGLLALVFSVSWTFSQRIAWQIGLVLILVSCATLYLAFTHPRFKEWIEFGEHLVHRDFSGIHAYEWDQVSEIRYVATNDSSDTDIMLSNGTTITIDEPPERFREVATSLLPSLTSGDGKARRRVLTALGTLAQINCYDSGFGTTTMHPDWVAEMRREMIPHLGKHLEDSDESVRAAAVDALDRIHQIKTTDTLAQSALPKKHPGHCPFCNATTQVVSVGKNHCPHCHEEWSTDAAEG